MRNHVLITDHDKDQVEACWDEEIGIIYFKENGVVSARSVMHIDDFRKFIEKIYHDLREEANAE